MEHTIAVSNETEASCSRLTKDGRKITYRLHVIQQPEQARACGAGAKASADRRPVDPPPIVELRIFEGENAEKDITFHFNANYFLFATLEPARAIANCRGTDPSSRATVLTGTPVAGLVYLDRPRAAGYFLFSDLSVRHEGIYRLSFNLYEELKEDKDAERLDVHDRAADGGPTPHVTHRLEVKSQPFNVFSAKKFPGLKESTNLSRCIAEQGCRVRIRKDVRMKKRDKPADDDADMYVPPAPEFDERGIPRDAKGIRPIDVSPQSGVEPGGPHRPVYHHTPSNSQSYTPSSASSHSSIPRNHAPMPHSYQNAPYPTYQNYSQPTNGSYALSMLPPPPQVQQQHPHLHQLNPMHNPPSATYSPYTPVAPPSHHMPSPRTPHSQPTYDSHYPMSTSSNESRPHTSGDHVPPMQHAPTSHYQYGQVTGPTHQDMLAQPTPQQAIVPAPHYNGAYTAQPAQPAHVQYTVPPPRMPAQHKMLPSLNTTHQVPSRYLEASSPSSAGPSPSYEALPRYRGFGSTDSAISSGKRTFGEVFDEQHINRPIRAGERPEVGVGGVNANGTIALVDHDAAEEAACSLTRMQYKRADGRFITKSMTAGSR